MISEELPVSSGAQWRKNREQGELIQLPYSGHIVRLRSVKPDMLLKLGKIPNVLTNLVVDMIYDQGADNKFEVFLHPKERAEEAMEMLESLRVVCTAGLVEPRIVDNPQADDEISIEDIELSDRGYIFRLVFAPADALSRFRYQPPSDVVVMENGAGEPQPSI